MLDRIMNIFYVLSGYPGNHYCTNKISPIQRNSFTIKVVKQVELLI